MCWAEILESHGHFHTETTRPGQKPSSTNCRAQTLGKSQVVVTDRDHSKRFVWSQNAARVKTNTGTGIGTRTRTRSNQVKEVGDIYVRNRST